MKTMLFAYGVLMYPKAVRGLTGKEFKQVPARLEGYRRHALKMIGYSRIAGLLPDMPESTVSGVLLQGIDKRSLRLFDAFERVHAGLYQRQNVLVQTADHQTIQVQTYILGERARRFIDGDWDQAEFERRYLRRYYHSIIPRFVRAHAHLRNTGGNK